MTKQPDNSLRLNLSEIGKVIGAMVATVIIVLLAQWRSTSVTTSEIGELKTEVRKQLDSIHKVEISVTKLEEQVREMKEKRP